ncbi:MAG: hypothetical protein KAG92_06510, partial [Deltaproteobacteria bacterium]|nr:hypothetical protein [Deltaproteobacteria bacterium]
NDTLIATHHNDSIVAGDGDDLVYGKGGADAIAGGAGNDLLQGDDEPDYSFGSSGNADILSGGSGDDVIHGAGGADIMIGGTGNDSLYGGGDGDTYLFSRGDGVDIIADHAVFEQIGYSYDRFGHGDWLTVTKDLDGGDDTLQFGEGITADDVVFYWDHATDGDGNPVNRDSDIGSNDLIVALSDPDNPQATIAELTDKIVIKDWFYRHAAAETKVAPPGVDAGDDSGGSEYGDNIMTGDYIQTAVSSDGTLGFGYSSEPGIKHDPTGTGEFGIDDYLTPGSPWEVFSVKSDQTGITTNNNARSDLISTDNLQVLSDVAPFDNYIRWTGHYGSYFSMQTDYFFNNSDEQINMTTTITALSDLSHVSFLRALD